MIQPSRTIVKLDQLRARKAELIERLRSEDVTDELRQLMQEIQATELEPHLFLCLACGQEFVAGDHVEFCVAATTRYTEQRKHADYGLKSPRNFIFCPTCSAAWVIDPFDYAEM
jgi:hypothetical protein